MNQEDPSTRTDTFTKLLDSVYVTEQTFDGMTVRGVLVVGSSHALIFDTLVSLIEPQNYSPFALIETLSDLEVDSRISTCVPSHGKIGGREIISYNVAYLKSLLSGAKFKIPYPVDAFYAAAHRENLDKATFPQHLRGELLRNGENSRDNAQAGKYHPRLSLNFHR